MNGQHGLCEKCEAEVQHFLNAVGAPHRQKTAEARILALRAELNYAAARAKANRIAVYIVTIVYVVVVGIIVGIL